jgi:hypothetical protein
MRPRTLERVALPFQRNADSKVARVVHFRLLSDVLRDYQENVLDNLLQKKSKGDQPLNPIRGPRFVYVHKLG